MGKHFEVEYRETCLVCGKLITNPRSRTYCSKKCRTRFNNKKNATYYAEYQRDRSNKKAEVEQAGKIQCPICSRWYIQICSHVLLVHKIKAREFKQEYGYDVKRGLIPEWYREVKADICKENGTSLTGEEGKKYWFKKGDKRAGDYERSPQTMERLKNLHKLNKKICLKK